MADFNDEQLSDFEALVASRIKAQNESQGVQIGNWFSSDRNEFCRVQRDSLSPVANDHVMCDAEEIDDHSSEPEEATESYRGPLSGKPLFLISMLLAQFLSEP